MAQNEDEYTGSKKVTCKQAIALLNEGKIRKAWFRPDKYVSTYDADSDPCFVWYIEKETK